MADDAAAMAQENKAALENLVKSLESYGIAATKAHKSSGMLEKGQAKLQAMWNKNPIINVTRQMVGMGKGTVAMLKHANNRYNMTKKEEAQNKKKMTLMQSMMANVLALGSTQKLYNKILKNTESTTKKLLINFLSLFGIFLLIGVGLAALSIAFQGANSPILAMSEGIPILEEICNGLLMIFSGEGEGGLGGAVNVAIAAFTAFAAIALVVSVPIGVLVGGLMLAVGVFQLVHKATDDFWTALLAAVAVGVVALGVAGATAGLIAWTTVGTILLPVALIIAAFAAIWAAITGKAPMWVGVIGAIALAVVAAIFFPVIAIPAAIIAAIAVIILVVQKFGDDIFGFFVGIKNWIMAKWGRALAFLTLAVATIVGFPAAVGIAILAIIWKKRDEIKSVFKKAAKLLRQVPGWIWRNTIGALIKKGEEGFDKLSSLGGKFTGFFGGLGQKFLGMLGLDKLPTMSGIIGTITGILMTPLNWLKGLVNAWIIDPINSVLGWNPPVIPGGKIKSILGMDYIPHLARGGIVTGPTTARIGEEGPEAVIPLSKTGFGSGLGGAMTVNINVAGVTDRTDKRRLAREISDILAQEMRRQGGATTRGHF